MSSTVSVAPREIRDLVYRVARVEGLEAGVADLVAERVLEAEIGVGGAVTNFVAAVNASAVAIGSFTRPVSGGAGDDQRRHAFESGVAIDTQTFEQLEALAARFLVAESVLDALE